MVAEFLAAAVAAFGEAVGGQHQQVTEPEAGGARPPGAGWGFQERVDDETGGLQSLDPAVGTTQERLRMTGVDPGESGAFRVQHADG
nr:hypothetical protein [Streptomyces sp. PanSC9]